MHSFAQLTLGLDGRLLEWNKMCESLTGMSASECIGKDFLDIVPDGHGLRDIITRAMLNTALENVETEVRIERAQ